MSVTLTAPVVRVAPATLTVSPREATLRALDERHLSRLWLATLAARTAVVVADATYSKARSQAEARRARAEVTLVCAICQADALVTDGTGRPLCGVHSVGMH